MKLHSFLLLVLGLLSISFPASGTSRRLLRLLDKYVYGAGSSYCYDHLDRTTYNTGFSSSDFASALSVDFAGGKIVLNTDQRALSDTNRILIRTRQNLTAKYVYESADQSQTLGWFLWDSRADQFTYTSGWQYKTVTCGSDTDCDTGETCRTCTGTGCAGAKVCAYPKRHLRDTGVAGTGASNGVYDWFEKLWVKPGGSNDPYTKPLGIEPFPLTRPPGPFWISGIRLLWNYDYYHLNGSSFSDGGTYPRISNYLEHLIDTGGQWLYLLADDDTDLETTVTCRSWDYGEPGCQYSVVHWQWGSFVLPPFKDNVPYYDGIPDYDVNGDGSVNALDRTVDMGTFDSGAELVFVLNSYYRNVFARYGSVGMKRGAGYYYDNVRVATMPYFTKKILNPDYKSSGTHLRTLDIGCSYTTPGGWPGNTCGGVLGWLDQAAINRLNTPEYNFLVLPHEQVTFHTIQDGIRDHVLLGAPSTDPNRWILGFEQLYDGGPGGENNSGNDYNDVVILIERQNGGEVVSNEVAREIPSSLIDSTTITKVKIKKNDHIPIPPCTPAPDTRIDYYISVGQDSLGNDIWVLVAFPTGSDEATIDLAALGLTGARLKWKVEIISSSEHCHPEVRDVDIGYEALVGGDYTFSTPIPLSNIMVKGTMETPSSSWTTITANDMRSRGHFSLYELYDPSAPSGTSVTKKWDAGLNLSTRNPNSRVLYTHQGLVRRELNTSSTSTWLLGEILSAAERTLIHNGKKVYDLNGDGAVTDDDARQILNWTRGWEHPIGSQLPSTPRRAWPLGAIHRSTAAVVTPPGLPDWYYHPAIPPAYKNSYDTYRNDVSIAERPTIALVGAQDGMVHAFDAGHFRWGDDPTTSVNEQRGYFVKSGTSRDYGDGRELWAWFPPIQLPYMKNNYHTSYYPETHPLAQVNGSFAIADVLLGTSWRTGAFYSHGTTQPYISGIDVTAPLDPQPIWEHDWTDSDFHGTYQSPAVVWANSTKYGGSGQTWAVITSSGMRDSYGDIYLFLIDADTGQTLPYGKVKLNTGSGQSGAQALGVWGSPVGVDWDKDGYVERIYLADTNGRVWKHYLNGSNYNTCLVADVGPEAIFTTPAFKVAQDAGTGETVVAFYFGTSDHPERNDNTGLNYHFFGFVDRDRDQECTSAPLVYSQSLPPDEKVWADAFISGDEVYVGTSTGKKADICDEDLSNPGNIYAYSLDADNNGQAVQLHAPVSSGGNVVSGLFVYDEHLFLNSLGGQTTILGGETWNNPVGAVSGPGSGYEDIYWKEF